MRWIAAMLLIANVGLYLWISGEQLDASEETPQIPTVVNREGMLLLSEVRAKPGSRTETGNTDTVASQGEALAHQSPIEGEGGLQSSPSLETTSIASIDSDSYTCWRIGPFKTESAWSLAKKRLSDSGIAFSTERSDSRTMRAIRVFSGPFSSARAADSEVARLESMNLDHFISPLADGTVRISLGYFTQEALANKFLGHLTSLGISARALPENRTLGPFSWLVLEHEFADIDLLKSQNWGESDIGLTTDSCQIQPEQ